MNVEVYNRVQAGETMTRILAGQALWRLSGPDRIRYLNGQVTNDVTTLAEGEARVAAVCTAKGRMEGVLFMTPHGEDLFLDAEPVLRESLGPRLEKYLIADDALLEDISETWSLSHVFGAAPSSNPDGAFLAKNARFGVPGYDVWIPGRQPVVRGHPVDDDVCETLRMEHAIPRWGAELTSQTLPPEAGPMMLQGISYTKGCYVGQETIARLKSVGHVNRTLVLLRSDSADFPPVGTKLTHAEKVVGTVTSSGVSPRFHAGLALGYVPPAVASEGTLLRAENLALRVVEPLRTGASR